MTARFEGSRGRGYSLALASLVVALTACGGGGDRAAAEAARIAEADAAKAKARAEALARTEMERLAALWNYNELPLAKGRQVSASIRSTNDVDTGGADARSVLLVFRDHPEWGRSSYVVLQSGDFNCSPRCTVNVVVDGTTGSLAAHRARTDEAIAMFIDDWRGMWTLTQGARQIVVDMPVKAVGTRPATFDVGGLDRSKMPGWDAPAYR